MSYPASLKYYWKQDTARQARNGRRCRYVLRPGRNPVSDDLQSIRREGLLDCGILGQCARLAGLKQVIQAGHLTYRYIRIPALLQRRFDNGQVHLWRHLEVFLTIDSEDGAAHLFNVGAGS
jgi:hypothetical protein